MDSPTGSQADFLDFKPESKGSIAELSSSFFYYQQHIPAEKLKQTTHQGDVQPGPIHGSNSVSKPNQCLVSLFVYRACCNSNPLSQMPLAPWVSLLLTVAGAPSFTRK